MKERNPFLLKADFGVLVSKITLRIAMLKKKKQNSNAHPRNVIMGLSFKSVNYYDIFPGGKIIFYLGF